MTKLIALNFLLFGLILNVHASIDPEFKDGRISGKIIDTKLNQPLPYVNVEFRSESRSAYLGFAYRFDVEKIKFFIEKIEITMKPEVVAFYNINLVTSIIVDG